VTLTNVGADEAFAVAAPDFPARKDGPTHALAVTRTVFIDRDDFREVDDAAYFGLAPGKAAGLRYAGFVRVTGVERDAAGGVAGLLAEYDHARTPAFGGGKVKGNLHWVGGAAPGAPPARVEVRLFDHLFLDAPAAPQGGAGAGAGAGAGGGGAGGAGAPPPPDAELNPRSETVLADALADSALAAPGRAPAGAHFQFERVGFFTADPDSRPAEGRLVFNLTVGLKEGAEAKQVKGGARA